MISYNNPLNIRRTGTGQWVGETTLRARPGAFCRFSDMKYGFRAAFYLLKKYYERYHLMSVGQIITRWAPPTENDTTAYIDFVVAEMKRRWRDIGPTTELPHPADDKEVWIELATAMAKMESGKSRITPSIVLKCEQGYHLMFP